MAIAKKPRVALITGGGAGIGRACARRFVREGYCVLIGDHSELDGHRTAREIGRGGSTVRFVPGDVSYEEDVQAWAEEALRLWGRIDVLVANAAARVFGSILDATEDDWEQIVDVNLKGVAYACRAALPAMIKQRRGAIVVVSSANALVGRAEMPLYDATKAAVLSLTRSLAVAYGPRGVRVNAVCPGFTITDFHLRRAAATGVSEKDFRRKRSYGLLGKPAEPDQIAGPIYFLASDDAKNITGQWLMADGGVSVTSASR